MLITDGDCVPAKIVPPQAGHSALLADRFLAEAGSTRATLANNEPPLRKPVMTFDQLVHAHPAGNQVS